MDYVVFGIGFGATILVLGLLLRDFGPRFRFRRSQDGGDVLTAEELVAKVSWTRFCTALGSVLALAGAVFLLITLVAMILVVSDDTGLWIMSIAFGLLLLIMAYWTWAYFHRFGSYGILPERAEPEPAYVEPRRRGGPSRQPAAADPSAANDDDAYDVEGTEPAAVDEDSYEEQTTDDDTEPAPAPASQETDTIAGDTETLAEAAEPPATRLKTPEERLAHAETPIDHGSAEGDLDLAAARFRRPGGPAPARPEAPANEEDDSATSTDSDRDRV